jgi:hypothetical protein
MLLNTVPFGRLPALRLTRDGTVFFSKISEEFGPFEKDDLKNIHPIETTFITSIK